MASDAALTRYPYPVEDPDDLRSDKQTLGNVSAVLTDARADVDDDNLLLASSWESATAATAIADVEVFTGLLQQDATRMATAAEAVGHYVGALVTAREDIDGLRTRYDQAVTARDEADADVPEGIEHNRYEREEYRQGNQRALERAADGLDTEYDEVLRVLGTKADTAVSALDGVLDALAPPQLRQAGTYGTASYDSAALALSLAATSGASDDPARRAGQSAAYEAMFGRVPSTPTEWSVAAVLDTTSHQDKNGTTDAILRVGRVTPQPGRGLVRIGLYIPTEDVFNVPNYDLGDDRGPDSGFDPEQTRVTLYVDYETGTVIARQNPSVDSEGNVRVDAPTVHVSETTTGAIRIRYDAENPFAPPDPTGSHTVNGEFVLTPPATDDGDWGLDGEIGDYPSFEAYHDDPIGRTTVIAQDDADMANDFGPLFQLPQHHDVGGGMESDPVKQFGTLGRPISGPYYEYTPAGPGTELGGTDGPPQITPQTPFGRDESLVGEPA